ncbi:hypothetical protein BLGI_1327 [Brevibacillus laterosporus GI-9]|nr:hypothetical protein BLGI_1327 [Brevibacillus laterosporus GI-9]
MHTKPSATGGFSFYKKQPVAVYSMDQKSSKLLKIISLRTASSA